jgi:Kinesin motor domain
MSSNPSMLPPFRDSALTRILKSIFLQNGKAIILVNINPASDCTDESMNTIRFAKYARHVKTMTVRKENYRPGSPEAKSSSHFKEEILNLKQKLALQTRLKSPLRVFSKDKLHLDVRSNREREQQQWQIEGEQMKRIMKENDKLKEEIQRLVQKQVHSMGGRSHAGKNDEIDSTNSGLEDLGLYL